MSGVKGRSGPRCKPKTLMDRALKNAGEALPELMAALVERGKAGDKDAAIYVIDRVMGRPKQEIDQKSINVNLSISPEDRYKLVQQALVDQARLLDVAQPAPGCIDTPLDP